MLWKIAAGVAGVVVVGIILLALTNGLNPFLTSMWNWIFTAIKVSPAPPSPFM